MRTSRIRSKTQRLRRPLLGRAGFPLAGATDVNRGRGRRDIGLRPRGSLLQLVLQLDIWISNLFSFLTSHLHDFDDINDRLLQYIHRALFCFRGYLSPCTFDHRIVRRHQLNLHIIPQLHHLSYSRSTHVINVAHMCVVYCSSSLLRDSKNEKDMKVDHSTCVLADKRSVIRPRSSVIQLSIKPSSSMTPSTLGIQRGRQCIARSSIP